MPRGAKSLGTGLQALPELAHAAPARYGCWIVVTFDRVFYERTDCAGALLGDVLVLMWEGPAHNDVLRRIVGILQDLKRGPFAARKLYVMNVVSPTASPPDAIGRQIAAKFLEHFDYHVNVTEGSDIRTSLIRAVLTGMMLISRVRARHDIADTVPRGIQKLVAAGASAPMNELAAAITSMRGRLHG